MSAIFHYVEPDNPHWLKYWERLKAMGKQALTREEFIRQYFDDLPQHLIDQVMQRRAVISCDCDYEFCHGWQMAYVEDIRVQRMHSDRC